MLTNKFIKDYKRTLKEDHHCFYDDINEYGNRDSDLAFYFIQGINGVPGQVRFALPLNI